MRVPRPRIRTLMIAVAAVALFLGAMTELIRLRRFAVELQRREAERLFRQAATHRLLQAKPVSPLPTGPPPAMTTPRTIGTDARAPE